MLAHRKYQCGKEPQFQCPFCVYKGRRRGHLTGHLGNKHLDQLFKDRLI